MPRERRTNNIEKGPEHLGCWGRGHLRLMREEEERDVKDGEAEGCGKGSYKASGGVTWRDCMTEAGRASKRESEGRVGSRGDLESEPSEAESVDGDVERLGQFLAASLNFEMDEEEEEGEGSDFVLDLHDGVSFFDEPLLREDNVPSFTVSSPNAASQSCGRNGGVVAVSSGDLSSSVCQFKLGDATVPGVCVVDCSLRQALVTQASDSCMQQVGGGEWSVGR